MQPNRNLAPSTVLLAGMIAVSCGTQIGNPTGSGLIRVTDEPNALGTLVNAAFMQTVDGMNMGDYAYSRLESRVTTDRSCQTEAGSGLSLVDKAESNHSVIDDTDEWSVKSDLTIKRSYQDAWTQNSQLLTCDSATRSVRFSYQRLQDGPIRLQSKVDEDLTRILAMTENTLKQPFKHTLSVKKSGTRTLDFVNYIEDGKEVRVEAQLSNKLTSIVKLNGVDGTPTEVSMQLQDRFPLAIGITLDANKEWSRYRIPSGQQEFTIAETGEILRLEFRNLIFSRDNGCVPLSGQLAATLVQADQTTLRYSLSFQPKVPMLMKRDGSNDSILLAPFACVLKER